MFRVTKYLHAEDIAQHLDLLPQSRSEEIVVYCKAGVRSMDACRVLNELGFERIYNLEGGMMRWRAENMPLTIQES